MIHERTRLWGTLFPGAACLAALDQEIPLLIFHRAGHSRSAERKIIKKVQIRGGLMTRWLVFLAIWLTGAGALRAADPLPESEVGYGWLSTRDPEEGEIQITSAPYTITAPGRYILMNDVSAEASAIGILSGDVTLDLNGHTVTYGTGVTMAEAVSTYAGNQSGNVGHSGVVAVYGDNKCPDFPFRWTHYSNIVIKNGIVRSGAGEDLAFSPAVNLDGTKDSHVRDMLIAVNTRDSEALIAGSSGTVQYCTLRHTGNRLTNRHSQLAVVVLSPGAEIHHCLVDGGPQVAVKANNDTEIHHNVLKQNTCEGLPDKPATAGTNGYGVQGYRSNNVHVHDNKIITYNGRGIHLSEYSSNWDVHDNYIEVRQKGDVGYSSMAAHGIKLEGTTGSRVYNNTVLCVGVPTGYPTSLNIGTGSLNQVYNNTFVALKSGGPEASGIYTVLADGTGSTFRDSTVYVGGTLGTYCYNTAGEGGSNLTFERFSFRKVDNDSGLVFARISLYKHNALDNRFLDCRFYDGIDPRSYSAVHAAASEDTFASYDVAWTFRLTTQAGATVTITDAQGTITSQGTADGSGFYTCVLREFAASFHNRDGQLTELSPYTVVVNGGTQTRTLVVPAVAPMECILDLSSTDPVILIPSVLPSGLLNQDYRFPLAVTGGAASWSVTAGALPPGIAIAGGALTGTPTAAGTYSATLQAGTAVKSISLTIEDPGLPYWRERVAFAQSGGVLTPPSTLMPDVINIADARGDQTPPTAPFPLHAQSPSDGVVDLSWQASTDNNGVIRDYRVDRDGTTIAWTRGTNFTDSFVPDGSHLYEVRAFDPAGNAGPAADASISIVSHGGGIRPACPRGLRVIQ